VGASGVVEDVEDGAGAVGVVASSGDVVGADDEVGEGVVGEEAEEACHAGHNNHSQP